MLFKVMLQAFRSTEERLVQERYFKVIFQEFRNTEERPVQERYFN